jgi:hypothetical protein
VRTLYFDIDGTLLLNDHAGAKTFLANGAFEEAVRAAEVDRLVCVGNFVDVVRIAATITPSYDGVSALFRICLGVFSNEAWFRENVTMADDAERRAELVDLRADWWYVDDLAEHYFRAAGRGDTFHRGAGKRIMVPTPNGDGRDVLEWLAEIPLLKAI